MGLYRNGSSIKIQTGSYTGTVKSGEANPNTLTFDFVPKFVYISDACAGSGIVGIMIYGEATGVRTTGGSVSRINVTWNDKTVSWWSASSPPEQLNLGQTYRWVAIG